ncbi:MAG: methylenetetrahydrofolate reductase [Actinomycetota bacterium]
MADLDVFDSADVCPKHMTHGPCGDVRLDGSCEVPGVRCPFVEAATVPWLGTSPARRELPEWLQQDRVILVDFPDPGPDAGGDAARRAAASLADVIDAALLGDSNWARVRFPPSYRASLLLSEGLRPWPGINARDRNAVALEGEMAALADLGVEVVHCVTGNHPVSGHRPEATPVFEVDSTQLAAMATDAGLVCSVAASALAVPVERRPARVAEKVRAGASLVIVDSLPDTALLGDFVAKIIERSDHTPAFLCVVPVPTSADDLDRLAKYPNAVEPPGWRDALDAAVDPESLGIRLAAELADSILDVDGVSGVCLGLTAGDASSLEAAVSLTAVARHLRG